MKLNQMIFKSTGCSFKSDTYLMKAPDAADREYVLIGKNKSTTTVLI